MNHQAENGREAARPWYREPWPWLLMAGPAAVVVAGLVTLWLAVATDDGLVADDYYKQGLAINKRIEREREAARRGLGGELVLGPGGAVRLRLAGDAAPAMLTLRLMHPTQAGRDQVVQLARGAEGYAGRLAPLTAGRWLVAVEDPERSWRLAGEWRVPQEQGARLAPAAGP